MVEILVLQSLDDHIAALDLRPKPVTVMPLSHIKGSPASSKRIEDQIPFLGREMNDSLEKLGRELVCAPLLTLEFPVPYRRNIVPDIGEIDPIGVHGSPMPSVILDVAAAMPAGLDRGSDLAKSLRLSLAVVEEAVVGWIKASHNWQTQLEADCDPVSKIQISIEHVGAEDHVPSGKVEKKQGASRFQNADAFIEPRATPLNVAILLDAVIDPGAVDLAQVKRRIGKDGVDSLAPNSF